MSIAQEVFARVWYLGLALTPLLIAVSVAARRMRNPTVRCNIMAATIGALLVSLCLPVVNEPGAWFTAAREEFRATGLAPCKPVARTAAPGSGCLTMQGATPWFVGALLLSIWHGLGFGAIRRRWSHGSVPPSRVAHEVAKAAATLGIEPPPIRMFSGRTSPMVVGVLRPGLMLPTDLWATLDDEEREAILLHELAHVQRRDLLTLALCRLGGCVFWWHPMIWWSRREIGRCAERACDMAATRHRPDSGMALARALLRVERFASAHRPLLPATAVRALSPAARDLAVRLRALAQPAARADRKPRGLGWIAFASVAGCGWIVVQIALG